MARILLKKAFDPSLYARDEEATEVLKKYKAGSEVWVTLTKARHPKHHRLYMGLLRTVFDNQDDYMNFTVFRKAVEFAAGHVEIIPSLDGEPLMQVKSIAWDEMDETEFSDLFPQVMRICVERFLRGVNMDELRAEVERYAA